MIHNPPVRHIMAAIWIIALGWYGSPEVLGQGVNFGTYVPEGHKYEIRLDVLQDLDFGQIISGHSSDPISIDDQQAAEIEIDAVEYLDVFVTIIEKPDYLWLDGHETEEDTKRIKIKLEFGYANAQDGLQGTRQLFTGTTARFPVRQRTGGPPRPPPTPPHSGYEPPRAKAYIVIGGILGNNGEIPSGLDAGNYSATIRLEVSYDL